MNGILNILKPPHMTSSDVVVSLKKLLGIKKIGHMGTLDPGAAGVLLCGIEKSARLFPYLLNSKKFYRAVFRFSISTDTLDSYGKITGKTDVMPSPDDVLKALKPLTGELMQRPPIYSAVNIGGKRAYDIARKGLEFEITPKKVFVEKFELINFFGEYFEFDIVCSGGTYIRSLCQDLALNLNSLAYMSSLVRIASGNFKIFNACTLDEIEDAHKNLSLEKILIKPEDALNFMEKIDLEKNDLAKLLNGVSINTNYDDGDYRIFSGTGFFGVAAALNKIFKLKTLLK